MAEWRHLAGVSSSKSNNLTPEIVEDVEITLLALGYSNSEIMKVLEAVSEDPLMAKSKQAEDWIRATIAWLSQNLS